MPSMYTREMQETLDIDWFLVDSKGIIAHFASGGGKLPKSVASSKNDNEILKFFFENLPDISSDVKINPKLNSIKKFASEESKTRYLKYFVDIARKGIYSFDNSHPGNFLSSGYHLVASPLKTLHIEELPREVIDKLSKTK